MKILSVDRIENGYVICEDSEKKYFALDVNEAPKGVKEGDILKITDEGEVFIDAEETKRRREKNKKLQDSTWA